MSNVLENFFRAFKLIVGEEGGFGNDPKDTGNWTGGKVGQGVLKGTKFGISAAAYPNVDIANLSLEDARAIYYRDYWIPIHGNELPWQWALPVFDSAVNQGVSAATKMMQDAVGVMVDGKIGPRTMAAVTSADDRKLARFFNARAQRYIKHPNFSYWGNGWLTRTYLICMESQR